MPPASSLIFVVIIAVWAAYLVQHWVRRRDHAATARSVDRFSEAMRVLERRRSLPRADLSPATPRSYAVAPARPAHPDVVVKRASSPAPGAQPVPQPRAARAPRSVRAPQVVRAARGSLLAPARLRAVALVAGVVLMSLLIVLGGASILPWWTIMAGPAVLALAVAVVRQSAAAERSSGPSARERHTPARQVQASVEPAPPHRDAVPTAKPRRVAAVYDVAAVEAQQASASEPTVTAADVQDTPPEPGTWRPVPVPPPTYTMKAKAVARAATVTPQPTPAQELPFDGRALALDEEFEELPAVHHG